ncbi:hypothetical protein B5C34_12495 [Pacificimonas flava]|uniref:Calcineurin-like phosphoesterase domain-containing protein n=2 Tax=Pacificimonas TaxID=1960290 RepID=A0A219B7N6_9SPHN|nr:MULTISPECIES: metallophosphoesterase [Pacificimonas]MBZ6378515.1 metallophosphoesterase [Pacificimonas aurantium]OWV34194.1 hypothetical protein B5C34_12495 [Pacificimonas flava]
MTVFFHASDLHFGIEDRRALSWFADAVAREQPDGVIITGDITQRARRREFDAAAAYLAALAAPVFVQPGNHDMPYYNLAERFALPYRRMRRVERAARKQQRWPGCTIVELNTTARAQATTNWSQGVVGGKALGHAVRQAETARPGEVMIVASHHPLFDIRLSATPDASYKESSTRGGSGALERLAVAGASAFLSGHVHEPYHRLKEVAGREVHLIGAGTLSTRVRSHPVSFNQIDVGGTHISVRHRTS